MPEKTYKEWLKEMKATGKRNKKNYDGIMKVIKAIPKEFLTEEMCLVFVKKDLENSYPRFLDLIPEEKKTLAVCLAAVEVNSAALEVVPEALKTKDVLLAYLKNKASQQYPHLITMFPKTLAFWNDESFCIEAVSANGHVIEYMPKEKVTKEICIIAFKSGRFDLDHFPEVYWQDDKFNSNIVSLRGLVLSKVPKKLRTVDLCVKAILNSGGGGNDKHIYQNNVPYKIRGKVKAKLGWDDVDDKIPIYSTAKEWLEAVQDNYKLLECVPDKLLTGEICLAAVQNDFRALEDVPDKFLSSEIYLAAVKSSEESFNINNVVSVFKNVPDNFITAEICLAAIQAADYLTIVSVCELVPDNLKTTEMCMVAVKTNGLALQCVPDIFKTKEICAAAIENNGNALAYMPDNLKTEKTCLTALQNVYDYDVEKVLGHVPVNLKSKVEKAFKK